jgi:hypothetical protein
MNDPNINEADTCLVYDVAILTSWYRYASSSVHCFLMDAQIVIPADRPPRCARWQPLEKKGSMNANKLVLVNQTSSN